MPIRHIIPWIPVYGDLPHHPKSIALESKTGVARAWSHVLELWLWCSRNRPEGNVADLTSDQLARYASWPKKTKTFKADLVDIGFLDSDGRVHGWDDHAGAYIRKLEADRARKSRSRAPGQPEGPDLSAGLPPDIHAPSDGSRGVEEKRKEEKKKDHSQPIPDLVHAREAPPRESDPPSASGQNEPAPRLVGIEGGLSRRTEPDPRAVIVWTAYVDLLAAAKLPLSKDRETVLVQAIDRGWSVEQLVFAIEGRAGSKFWRTRRASLPGYGDGPGQLFSDAEIERSIRCHSEDWTDPRPKPAKPVVVSEPVTTPVPIPALRAQLGPLPWTRPVEVAAATSEIRARASGDLTRLDPEFLVKRRQLLQEQARQCQPAPLH